jgi:hypothetical protein
VKGLVTSWSPASIAVWEKQIREALGNEVIVDRTDPESLDSEQQILKVIHAGYSFVMLPLSLPNYMSLRLAELVHQLESPTRLILCSGTDLEDYVLLTLFDSYVPAGYRWYSGRSVELIIKEALQKEVRRVTDPARLQRNLTKLLRASCFRIGQSVHDFPRHLPVPTVEQYRFTTSRVAKVSYTHATGIDGLLHTNEDNLRPDLFISYSHKDLKWLNRLEIVLRPLTRERKIMLWSDRQIVSGCYWQSKIARVLESAKAALLLVSQNFMASDFIANHELPQLLDAAAKGRVRILWLAVSASLQPNEISQYQALSNPATPLDTLRPAARNQELVRIAEEIANVLVI